ncbi:hypothetical protein ACHAWF_008211, partial [Thalassiosira exigua]
AGISQTSASKAKGKSRGRGRGEDREDEDRGASITGTGGSGMNNSGRNWRQQQQRGNRGTGHHGGGGRHRYHGNGGGRDQHDWSRDNNTRRDRPGGDGNWSGGYERNDGHRFQDRRQGERREESNDLPSQKRARMSSGQTLKKSDAGDSVSDVAVASSKDGDLFTVPEDEEARKKACANCLVKDDEGLSHIPTPAFQVPVGWAERTKAAAAATLEEFKTLRRDDNQVESDDSDSDDYCGPGAPQPGPRIGLKRSEKEFILALPHCIPLDLGFHVLREGEKNRGFCYCPCSKKVEPWGKPLMVTMNCGNETFYPNDLMDHLKKMGGKYEEKEHGKKVMRPLRDIYHHGARVYLEHLYSDWLGEGFGHRALYPRQSTGYKNAVYEETRLLEREIVMGRRELRKQEEENAKLQAELETKKKETRLFQKLARDHEKKVKELELMKDKLNVVKKDKEELSDVQVANYKQMIAGNFEMMRQLSGNLKDIKITVVGTGSGFSLQHFFDDLYEQKKGPAWTVLFGDDHDANKIGKLILSEWKIIYGKHEGYDFKRKADAKAQKDQDTAVDEGGPSRQFLTDVFKQLNSLRILPELQSYADGDGKRIDYSVEIYENTPSGVMVITDEKLTHDLERSARVIYERQEGKAQEDKKMTKGEEKIVDASIKRARDYTRAIGRIILHAFAFADKYTLALPSNAMPAFIMQLMLRGYSNETYDNDDILNHIDALFRISTDSILKWLLDPNSDERDENGREWTSKTFFQMYIPKHFIHTRKILLGGLHEGLSLVDKSDPKRLEEGCGVASMFKTVPLEAIKRILFAKPNVSIDDLIGVLNPKFGEGDPDPAWGMPKDAMESHTKMQETFFKGDFQRYLRESAKEDETFLVKFLECATGMAYLPHDKNFKIKIEFNFSIDPCGLPTFHACTFDVVLPGVESFFCDYKTFKEEKMNFAVNEVHNQFNMN